MAFTFTTLKSAIQDYLESSETTFVNNLPLIIQQAEQRILRTAQIPDLRKNVTGTLSKGNPYLAMPTDFLAPYSLAIENSGSEFLLFKDVNFMREAYPVSATEGVPKYYSMFDAYNFIVAPTPSANFAAELHFMFEPQSIALAASGTSWLGTNAEMTLLYACLVEGYTFLKGEPEQMQWYNAKFEDAVSRLKSLGEGYDTTDNYRSGTVRSARI
jgi:hypothetical protein|tara:strand:+ start:642 stop:1283 length:642 start_codon:yes stop_codon:yes gene_type:complete